MHSVFSQEYFVDIYSILVCKNFWETTRPLASLLTRFPPWNLHLLFRPPPPLLLVNSHLWSLAEKKSETNWKRQQKCEKGNPIIITCGGTLSVTHSHRWTCHYRRNIPRDVFLICLLGVKAILPIFACYFFTQRIHWK